MPRPFSTVNSASNKAEVDYYYGMIDLKQGDLNAADKYFKDGAAADAKYPFNLVGQAAVLLKNGNKSAAEALFKQARNLTKKNVDLECAIARAYFFADPTKYESQVNKCLLNARKYGKNSPQPDIVQGDIYFASQDWGNSMASYEQAMGYDPSNIESTVKYADTYFKVNPELAIARLKDIIQSNPNSALVQRQLAEKLYEHGDFVEAAAMATTSIARRTTSPRMRLATPSCSTLPTSSRTATTWLPSCARACPPAAPTRWWPTA